VVTPHDVDELAAIISVCHSLGAPVTFRGRGTSVAGNSCGPGVVIDVSRPLPHIEPVDETTRTVPVQPGAVLDSLQHATAPYGLRFGPDPSTHSRCTIGGMIGNNACGSHSVAYGKTADNVESLEVLLADGRRLRAGRGELIDVESGRPGTTLNRTLRALVDPNPPWPGHTRRLSQNTPPGRSSRSAPIQCGNADCGASARTAPALPPVWPTDQRPGPDGRTPPPYRRNG
jgi:FAD binding domain-containing protein